MALHDQTLKYILEIYKDCVMERDASLNCRACACLLCNFFLQDMLDMRVMVRLDSIVYLVQGMSSAQDPCINFCGFRMRPVGCQLDQIVIDVFDAASQM